MFTRRLRLAISILCAAATGCASAPPSSTTSSVDSSTSTVESRSAIPSITIAPYDSPLPSETVTPRTSATVTITPLPSATLAPSHTPNFSPPNVTRTSAPAAECPIPGHQRTLSLATKADEIGGAILNFLNAGGTTESLQSQLRETKTFDTIIVGGNASSSDVTGDGMPEVLAQVGIFQQDTIGEGGRAWVFGCVHKAYQMLLAFDAPSVANHPPELFSILDMNADGVPEIVYTSLLRGGQANSTVFVHVFEWNGSAFDSLVSNQEIETTQGGGGYHGQPLAYMENGNLEIRDTDKNGTLEIVLLGDFFYRFPPDPAQGPQRLQTDLWMWNGQQFVLVDTAHTSPVYRFQAVQDGDDASMLRQYDEALALYQLAIFDSEDVKLLGWSQEWLYYFTPFFVNEPQTPTPLPTPSPDPAEYPRLSAYSRYRIMLLHAVRGYVSDAKVVYDALQEKFPAGNVGHPYAEMATAFWNEYDASQNIGAACAKAIAYASAHYNAILNPLSSYYYGFLNRDYKPEDICPFK